MSTLAFILIGLLAFVGFIAIIFLILLFFASLLLVGEFKRYDEEDIVGMGEAPRRGV